MSQTRLLFVCLGNICRSPLAQGVFAHVAKQAGHGERFIVDSAGTGAWHIGNPPDPRAQTAAAARGIDVSAQRARRVRREDFSQFDLLLAMDAANRAALLALSPEKCTHKVRLFLDDLPKPGGREVPDPYYGGAEGFEQVLDLIEAGSRALLARLT